MKLTLTRPLAVIDVETTGTNVETDRVVEIAVEKLYPDGHRTRWSTRINPGMPIPADASAVHHITDADVASAPALADIAGVLVSGLTGCDLGGFNLRAFDLPLLRAEFKRAGRAWPFDDAKIVDALVIFREREKRDLATAVRWYLGREHEGAHGAEADAVATLDVIIAQVDRYTDLPRDVAGLDVESGGRRPDWATEAGHFRWREDGELVVAFGKYAGQRVVDMTDGYLAWVRKNDFPQDVKDLALRAMQGHVLRDPRLAMDDEARAVEHVFGDDVPF